MGYVKKSRDFFGYPGHPSCPSHPDKFRSWNFLGIKYEPLSDPPVIKICEWGPWGSPTAVDEHRVPAVSGPHSSLLSQGNKLSRIAGLFQTALVL